MNYLDGNSLREMISAMPTPALEEMLHRELKREPPDDASVRLILSVLEERERDTFDSITPEQEAAWQRYQRCRQPSRKGMWVKAASIVLLAGLLLLPLTQTARAESIWDLLARWTDSVFQFLDPREGQPPAQEYVFQTQNPGLQQLYDAVTELGITDPVVPMWLPNGYELVECETAVTPISQGILATFSDGKSQLVYNLSNASGEKYEYYKDDSNVIIFEKKGVEHHIMQNLDNKTAVWNIENIEIHLTGDCAEDIFYKILISIYTVEEFN